MTQQLVDMKAVLDAESDTLVSEILRLAMAHGFTDQTSSMRAAWSEATERLNACLVGWRERSTTLDGRRDYRRDPRFEDLREIAWRHHDAGVPLELHHGLFQLYRKTYLDLFAELCGAPETRWLRTVFPDLPVLLDAFFDEADQAMLAHGAMLGSGEAALADSVRRLTRERDQFFGVFESLRGPVLLVDAHDALLNANQAALQTFIGLSEAGALTYRLAVNALQPDLQTVVDRILEARTSDLSGIWLDTFDGQRCFDIRIRLIEDSVYKLDRCRIILMNDVTEYRRAVERAQSAERSMSVFLAAMSHEIRTPLHSALGAASLLQDAPAEEISQLVELVGISAQALNSTLANVLSFSRFEHQSPEPRLAPIALPSALRDLFLTKEILAKQQGVPLRFSICEELPETALLDWSMTRQVLSNLIQNALRFDDGRGITVAVSCADNMLGFEVLDHGPGLPAEVMTMLAQAPAALKPRQTDGNGIGIGMAIAQRMTLALGGTLGAENTDDGARVFFQVPLLQEEAPVEGAETLPSGHMVHSCLLLEDDQISAQVTRAMLERLGVSVDHATTIGHAIALCRAYPDAYDLFIMDHRLPDGNGTEFAAFLQADSSLSQHLMLLLSANAELIARHHPEDCRYFTAMLEKPLDTEALTCALRSLGVPEALQENRFLSGLTPEARDRMAVAFSQTWSEFRHSLIQKGKDQDRKALALRAHKLAGGARIFGYTGLATSLRSFEVAFDGEETSVADLDNARRAVLHFPADLEQGAP